VGVSSCATNSATIVTMGVNACGPRAATPITFKG